MMLWPLALHFGLYWLEEKAQAERPPLVGAFWARSLADAPLTLGHLYPVSLFKGLMATDVFEFGGLVADPQFDGKGLLKMIYDTARLFLFSRRPEVIITNPVEPLVDLYRNFGLKTVGSRPVEYPYLSGVKVYLMYGRFRKLAAAYFM